MQGGYFHSIKCLPLMSHKVVFLSKAGFSVKLINYIASYGIVLNIFLFEPVA